MSEEQPLEAGSRHDLRTGVSPDAPDEDKFKDEAGAFGYCHSYETSSRYDGPGLRIVLFVSGCLLRCTYCHNPDTWHLKDGTYVSAEHVLRRLGDFAPGVGFLAPLGGVPPESARAIYRRWLKNLPLREPPRAISYGFNVSVFSAPLG